MFAIIFMLQILKCTAVNEYGRITELWGQAVCVFGRRGQVHSMLHMNILSNAYKLPWN